MCRLNHHRASFNKQIKTFTFQSTTQCVEHRWQTASFAFQWESKLDRIGENGNLAENLFARFSDSLAEC